jgi:hypothetical protein
LPQQQVPWAVAAIHGKASQSQEETVAQGHAREPRPGTRRGVFSQRGAGAIARSLKRAAERSRASKSAPLPVGDVDADLLCQPLGAGLSASRPKTLEGVKDELRRLFDKQKA